MPIISKVVCDVCEAEKKSENHWWVATPGVRAFVIQSLEPGTAVSAADFILCGERCVLKKISEWMGAKK